MNVAESAPETGLSDANQKMCEVEHVAPLSANAGAVSRSGGAIVEVAIEHGVLIFPLSPPSEKRASGLGERDSSYPNPAGLHYPLPSCAVRNTALDYLLSSNTSVSEQMEIKRLQTML